MKNIMITLLLKIFSQNMITQIYRNFLVIRM